MAERPLVFFTTMDGKSANVSDGSFEDGDLEQAGFAHEEDRAWNAQLHGDHIEICEVIGSQHHAAIGGQIFNALHFELHDQLDETAHNMDNKPSEWCGTEGKM